MAHTSMAQPSILSRPAAPRARMTSTPMSCGSGLFTRSWHPFMATRGALPVGDTNARHRIRTSTETIEVETQQDSRQDSRQDSQAATEKGTGSFAWTKQWYPVTAMDSLDPKVPVNIKLLGESLVVWSDGKGNWHCMDDKCSHRLAPLSEGRVEDGHIMCSYHGWRFDEQGQCTQIPQIKDPKAHAFACSQPGSKIKVFPTKVEHGLLWLWPEAGLEALQESYSTPTNNNWPKDTEKGTWDRPYTWFVRDLPCRFDTVTENLIDISHAPYAHHGVPGMGDRYKDGGFTYARDSAIERDSGFVLDVKGRMSTIAAKISFTPPVYIRHAGPGFCNEIIVVPTSAGWSRVFMTSLMMQSKEPAAKPLPLPFKLLGAFKKAFPALDHVLLKHAIFDGDTYMLHLAERELLKKNNDWRSAFFMPAQDDLPIVTFRRWLQDHGGEVPTLGPLGDMPPEMSKRQALDRYQQHTSHCSHCQQAVKTIDAGMLALSAAAAAAVLVIASKALLGLQALLQPGTLVPLAVAGLCSLMAYQLSNLKKMFFYVEYVHAHKD